MQEERDREVRALIARLRRLNGEVLNIAGRLGVSGSDTIFADASEALAETFDEVSGLRNEIEKRDVEVAHLRRQVDEQARQIELLQERRAVSRTEELQRRQYRRRLADARPLDADE